MLTDAAASVFKHYLHSASAERCGPSFERYKGSIPWSNHSRSLGFISLIANRTRYTRLLKLSMASFDRPGTSLNGWHPGERAMQHKMGYDKAPGVSEMWRFIYGEMTDQHQKFHTSNLHFLPVVTLDKTGRPWSSILTGEDGNIGWITSSQRVASTLLLKPRVWEGDPFWDNADQFDAQSDEEGMLIAGIGVEVSTRRRNKLAGKIKRLERNSESRRVMFDIRVDEATG
jgi:hypothetical protein